MVIDWDTLKSFGSLMIYYKIRQYFRRLVANIRAYYNWSKKEVAQLISYRNTDQVIYEYLRAFFSVHAYKSPTELFIKISSTTASLGNLKSGTIKSAIVCGFIKLFFSSTLKCL